MPSGIAIKAGLKQEACQPLSHLSQSSIHSGLSDLPHFWQTSSIGSFSDWLGGNSASETSRAGTKNEKF